MLERDLGLIEETDGEDADQSYLGACDIPRKIEFLFPDDVMEGRYRLLKEGMTDPRNKNNYNFYYQLGIAALKRPRPMLGESLRYLKVSININEKNANTHFLVGLVSFYLDRFKDSVESLKNCLKLNGNHYFACFMLAKAYFYLGHQKEAMDCVNKAIISFPRPGTFFHAYNLRGIFRMEEKVHIRMAMKDFVKAKEGSHYRYFTAIYNRGSAFFELGRYSAAIDCFEEAIKLNGGTDFRCFNNLGVAIVAREVKNPESMEEDFLPAALAFSNAICLIEEDERPVNDKGSADEISAPYINRAKLFMKYHDYQRALKDFQITIEIFTKRGRPRSIPWQVLNDAASCYVIVEEVSKGLEIFEKAVEVTAGQPNFLKKVLQNRAHVYEEICGNKKAASKDKEKIMDINENQQVVASTISSPKMGMLPRKNSLRALNKIPIQKVSNSHRKATKRKNTKSPGKLNKIRVKPRGSRSKSAERRGGTPKKRNGKSRSKSHGRSPRKRPTGALSHVKLSKKRSKVYNNVSGAESVGAAKNEISDDKHPMTKSGVASSLSSFTNPTLKKMKKSSLDSSPSSTPSDSLENSPDGTPRRYRGSRNSVDMEDEFSEDDSPRGRPRSSGENPRSNFARSKSEKRFPHEPPGGLNQSEVDRMRSHLSFDNKNSEKGKGKGRKLLDWFFGSRKSNILKRAMPTGGSPPETDPRRAERRARKRAKKKLSKKSSSDSL